MTAIMMIKTMIGNFKELCYKQSVADRAVNFELLHRKLKLSKKPKFWKKF